MMKDLLCYDCEVFKEDNLVILKRLDGSVYGIWWNDDTDRPAKLRQAVRSFRLVGYNNYNYDDYIITLMMDESKTVKDIKQLNDKIIKGIPHDVKPDPEIDSIDAMQQIDIGRPSLKQIQGNLGMSIEESSVPFDIDEQLTDEQRAETEHYCEHDVDATIKVYNLRIKDYFEIKQSLIAMLPEEIQSRAKRWNTTTISANLLMSNGQTAEWSGFHGLDELWQECKYIPQQVWKMWGSLTQSNIMDKGYSITIEGLLGCDVTFGVGGLHGAPPNPEVFENVIDADVASMYPSIIVLPQIRALGKATAKYDGIRKQRVQCKKTDPVKAKALKLVLNSVYGNFKNQFSTLKNPFAGTTVCIYGQIAAMDLAGSLFDAGYRITNINTDGIMFLANPNAETPYEEIFLKWQVKYGLSLEAQHFDKFIQRDVNNYIAVEKGVIKAKGGDCNRYDTPLPFKSDDARVVQIAFVEYMVNGTPIEETLVKNMGHPEMFQYVLKAGPTFRCVKDSEGNVMNKVNRVFACEENEPRATVLKKWKADGTSSRFADAPQNMFVYNGELNAEFMTTFMEILDIQHYVDIVKKKIEAWTGTKRKATKRKTKATTEEAAEEATEEPQQKVKVKPVDQLESVAKRFKKAKKTSGGWIAYCPVHEKDGKHTPSLKIAKNKHGKGICLWCESQHCSEQAIMTAVGLTYEDLGKCKRIKITWESAFESSMSEQLEGKAVTVKQSYDYHDEKGKYLWTKVRYYIDGNDKKQMRFIRKTGDPDEPYLEGKGVMHPDPVLYNLPQLLKAIEKGIPVYYVEGEKDVETLRTYHMTATTAGGSCDWNKALARYFRGSQLTIMEDNDEAGKALADQVMKHVKPYAFAVRRFVPSSKEKGDITDYLNGEGDIEAVNQRLEATEYDYAYWVEREMKKSGDYSMKVSQGILAQTVRECEHFFLIGDGASSRYELYEYNGIGYKKAPYGIERIVTRYIPNHVQTSSIIKSTKDLILDNRRRYRLQEIEQESPYIIVKNGVIDTRKRDDEGRFELLPHDPKYRIKTILDVEYDPNAECPVFDSYLNDLCRQSDGQVNIEKRHTIEQYAGLIISNERVMKCKQTLWLYSTQGNTGKSQLLKVLTGILGAGNHCNVSINTMNRDRNKFTMSSIVGTRLIQIPDCSGNSVEESQVFKQLAGGDAIAIEGKGRDEFTYEYKGGLIAAANGLPTFKDDKGNHIAQRMIIIPCNHHIEEADRDPDISSKMEQERSGILNVLLNGLARYLDSGSITISEASRKANEDYKINADTVYRYLTEVYTITHNDSDRIKTTDFNDGYQEWYKQNYEEREYSFAVATRNIPERLAGHGIVKKTVRMANTTISAYVGLKLK